VGISASYHQDDNGLPGGVGKENRDSKDKRKKTERPDDSGETTDRRYETSVEIDLLKWGSLDIRGGYRDRDNSYLVGFTPLLTREEQTDAIDEDTKTARLDYDLVFQLFGLDQRIRIGGDYAQTEYIREERSRDNRENSDTENKGIFVATDSALSKDLSLRMGYRANEFKGDFRTDTRQIFGSTRRWVNGTPSEKKWSNHAEEVGIVYTYQPDISFFSSYATTFRVPNVDELAQAEGDLRPQEGAHVDVGGKVRYRDWLEFAVTFFEIRIDDEIFFDGNVERNNNFDDQTVRRGLETDVRLYAGEAIYLWGNYTYTDAKFDNRDTWVPLVPEHMARGGIEWQIMEPLTLSITGTYVGPRFDGNDQNNNRFDKLDGYALWDAKVIFQRKGLKVFAGVNNIFNRLYSHVAYSEIYYPMPERNFYGGVEWVF
jgi:outer membrane receptor protein involved in Fe transport